MPIDRLLADLNIKLRINRRDPRLPDNHGQIWTQLVSVVLDADLGRDDWDRLVVATADGRTREAVEVAFYTSNGGDRSYYRTTGLLKTIDNAVYWKVCWAMWIVLDLALVDLKYLFCSKRPEMETAVRVLYYVIGWIYYGSVVDLKNVNPKSKSKPQLLHYL
ncbi:hypothetical protein CMUS01_14591 [Colletotrichum musicola]|uniref:Uncharacterized protein n=1 Tax=Colletotrichum musicola TaxID=2175873 RepID=A0A8H6MRI5_9PEZI|nr:hypothetical protein CMUS01_14591 [Colletotrichum musicola]